MYEYKAELIRVVDGDTVDLDVDLGMRVHVRARIRMIGVNAPEIYSVKKDSEEYKKGLKAKIFLINLLKGQNLILWTKKDRTGKYGRWLGTIGVTEDNNRSVVKFTANNAINDFIEEMESKEGEEE